MSPLSVVELELLSLALEEGPLIFCWVMPGGVVVTGGAYQVKKIATARPSVRMMAKTRESFLMLILFVVGVVAGTTFVLAGVKDAVTMGCGNVCCCESWYWNCP